MIAMTVNTQVLREARDALARDLGPLDDLSDEMKNTLANIYYKFVLMVSMNLQLQKPTSRDVASAFKEYMLDAGQILTDYKFAAELVKSMREVRKQDQSIYEFLETHFFDVHKFRIKNANKKSGLRRAIERPFAKVDEIPDLYKQMLADLDEHKG